MPKMIDRATGERLLTPAEVADQCRATPRQVRRWLDERRLAFVELPRGRRVPESALHAFLARRTVEAEDR